MPRVLVIDDDEDVRLLISNIASAHDWQWDTLCDGQSGWAVLANAGEVYDLIFVDLRLPGHSGEELVSMADKVVDSQKVVIITGTIGELADVREKTLSMWKCVRAIIHKPFGPDDIAPHLDAIAAELEETHKA